MNTPNNVALLQAVVTAKLAYWDALSELEKVVAPGGEFNDYSEVEVPDIVAVLAADGGSVGSQDLENVIAACNA